MTNLSKELCEICGIEPHEDKYCFWQCKNPELENKPCNNAECPHYRHYLYYVNFASIENFWKLYEIVSKQTRTEFLQRLVERLRVESGWYTDELKQAIREKEWKYD